jgi:hypothetical protein
MNLNKLFKLIIYKILIEYKNIKIKKKDNCNSQIQDERHVTI